MSKSNAAGIKPNSSFTDNGEQIVFMPCNGADNTANRAISAVVRGNPTLVTLTSAPAYIKGQYVLIASIVGMTELNGYQKVLDIRAGNVLVLDVDSSAYTAWASGGTVNSNNVHDVFGNYGPTAVLGTVTALWPADGSGLKTDFTTGNYLAKSTDSLFDLSTMTSGILALSFDVTIAAATVGAEYFFTINRSGDAGAGSENGGLYVGFYGGSQNPTLRFYTGNASAAGSVAQVQTAAIAAAGASVAQFILDFNTDTIYSFLNGTYKAAASISRSAGYLNPKNTLGAVFFAGLSTAGAVQEELGKTATVDNTNTATIKNVLFWRTTKTLTQVQRALGILARTGEFPAHLL